MKKLALKLSLCKIAYSVKTTIDDAWEEDYEPLNELLIYEIHKLLRINQQNSLTMMILLKRIV